MRSARAQRNHLGLCLQAFLRLEAYRLQTGMSWYEAKASLIRDAVRTYSFMGLMPRRLRRNTAPQGARRLGLC